MCLPNNRQSTILNNLKIGANKLMMNEKLKNLLIGAGSVLSIYPAGDVTQINFNHKTDAENLSEDWNRVGSYLYDAMAQIDDEQKEKSSG